MKQQTPIEEETATMAANHRDDGFAQFALSNLKNGNRGEIVRRKIEQAGVEMTGPDAGRLNSKTKKFPMSVQLEADEWLRVRSEAIAPESLCNALERHAGLPGNVRFARGPAGVASNSPCGPPAQEHSSDRASVPHKPPLAARWSIVAETRLDGVDHLSASLGEIIAGFSTLSAATTQTSQASSGQSAHETDAGKLQEVVQRSAALGSDAVEIESGWELRPRVGGQTVPVEARVVDAGMRVFATVLRTVPDTPAELAMADQALRLNAQLRLARLSLIDGALVAESYLRPELITPDWLEMAARAVATACCVAEEHLSVLAEEAQLAERYLELFLDT